MIPSHSKRSSQINNGDLGRAGPTSYLPDCDTCHFSLTSAPTTGVTDPRHYYKSSDGDPMANVDALALATRLPRHTK